MNASTTSLVDGTRLRLIAIAVLGVFSLFLVPVSMVEAFFIPQTWFGFDFDDQTLQVVDVDPRAAKAGLHLGDRLDVARMSYDDRVKLFPGTNMILNWPSGTVVTVAVRNASPMSHEIRLRAIPNDAYPQSGQLRFALWTHAAIAFFWVLVGAIVVAMRPSVMTWAFYFICLAFHPFPKYGMFYGPPWVTAIFILGFVTIYALGIAGLISFTARFPRGTAEGGWKFFELAAPPILVVFVALRLYGWVPAVIGTPIPFDTYAVGENIVYVIAAASLVGLFVKLIRLRGAERVSTLCVFAGFAVSIVGIALFRFESFDAANTDWRNYALVALNTLGLAAFPLSVAYAAVWHRAFGLGFFTNRVLVYGLFAVTFGMMFVVFDWIASAEVNAGNIGVGIGLGVALVAGLVTQSQYRRAIGLVDRIFLPQRYAARVQLDRIRDAIHRGAGWSSESVAADVAEVLGLASIAVFIRTADGGFVREAACGWPEGTTWHVLPEDDLCRTLTRGPGLLLLSERDVREIVAPPADARPQVAIAVRRSGRIERAILIGSRRTGTTLDRDEMRNLAAVFSEAAA